MKRILTAIVLIALVIALVFFGKPWMITVCSAIVAGLAALEFRSLAATGGSPVPLWWTLGSIALFFLATFLRPQDTIVAVAFATLVLFTWSALRSPLDRVLSETAAGLLMLVYIAYPLTLIPQIWNTVNGTALLLFLFLCVWSGDIAALYVGRNFGRSKLAPQLSPNKTWAGALASIAASVLFGMALVLGGDWLALHGSSFTKLHTTEPWWQFLLLAILLNIAAQFGDLLESALKRGANVKDSGTLLPGHGGILDRIDALLVAAPVLWFVLVIREFFSPGSF